MENNEAFVGGDNTNQCDGLNGLGAVCNKSMCFESSTFETPETNSDCLIVDKSKFSTLDSFYTYLRQWFNSTGVVTVQDTTDVIKSKLNYAYIFDIGFPNSDSKTHAVIACHDIGAAKYFLSKCKTGKFSEPALMFCFYNFDTSDKRIAANNNIELVGISEMHDLNNAITSVFGGLTIGNTLLGKLQKGLREKFKDQRPITDVAQDSVNNTGNEIMHAINDGFDQLKGSIASALVAIGAGKIARSVQDTNNPFANQNDIHVMQTNSPEAGFVDNTGRVNLNKNDRLNLNKETGQPVQQAHFAEVPVTTPDGEPTEGSNEGKHHASLEKAVVQTTDNVVEHRENTIDTAADFLNIQS